MSTAVRVEANKATTLEQSFYVDGGLTSSSTAVTVTITKADGTALVTGAATTNPSVGVYRYVLEPQATLNHLTVVWSGTWGGTAQTETSRVEVVGDFYVSLAEIRALPNLSDVAKFTNAEIIAARTWFEQRWEAHVGVAFVPRFARDRIAGSGSSILSLPHWPIRVNPATGVPSVYSVRTYTDATTYTSLTSTELGDLTLDASGYLRRFGGASFASGKANIVVEYEHAAFEHAPPDVADAAAVGIRQKLLRDQTGDRGNRQYGTASEGVFVRNVTGPFFNDELNSLADDYRSRWHVPAFV